VTKETPVKQDHEENKDQQVFRDQQAIWVLKDLEVSKETMVTVV